MKTTYLIRCVASGIAFCIAHSMSDAHRQAAELAARFGRRFSVEKRVRDERYFRD